VNDRGAPEGGLYWENSPVPADGFIRGLQSVKLMVRDLEPTARVLTEVLSFQPAREYPSPEYPEKLVLVYEVGRGGPGTEVHVEAGRTCLTPIRGMAGCTTCLSVLQTRSSSAIGASVLLKPAWA
jgi:hypothetical protein